MRIEGDFEVVSRGDNRVTLSPVGDVKVLDGSFDLSTTKTLKDKIHAVLEVTVDKNEFYEPKVANSDEELLESAIQKVWSDRGGISGNPRPKDDDAEVIKLLEELKGYRDDDNPENDIFLSPLVRKQKDDEDKKREEEGEDTIGVRKDGEPSNLGGVSENPFDASTKEREVREEAQKRQPSTPPLPGSTAMVDAFKAKENS